MKGGCWKEERKEGMGINDKVVVKEEAQMSGAYIRSLVKQLTSTSSRSKDSNPSAAAAADQLVADGNAAQNLTNLVVVGEAAAAGSGFSDRTSINTSTRTPAQSSSSKPQPHKKQVRRRLHTSRPYQERLLNMAEARREIVTALKFHRAAMKQAAANYDQQQQQQQQEEEEEEEEEEEDEQLQQQQQQPLCVDQYSSSQPFQPKTSKSSRRNPRIYPAAAAAAAAAASSNTSTTTTTTSTINTNTLSPPSSCNYNYNLDYSTTFPNYYNYNYNYNNLSSHQNYPPPNPYSNWPSCSIPTTVVDDTTLNLALPNQTLGLNLNFHDFNSIIDDDGATLNNYIYPNTTCTNPSVYSSSNSPPLTAEADDQLLPLPPSPSPSPSPSGLHQAINEEEMAEIRSLGEQHQMEWNDTMNLVTSAWWFKFLKTMELGPADQPPQLKPPAAADEDAFHQPFDHQLAQFPVSFSH